MVIFCRKNRTEFYAIDKRLYFSGRFSVDLIIVKLLLKGIICQTYQAYGNIQDNDILYNNGMYCRVEAIKPIDIPEFNKHMITPPS